MICVVNIHRNKNCNQLFHIICQDLSTGVQYTIFPQGRYQLLHARCTFVQQYKLWINQLKNRIIKPCISNGEEKKKRLWEASYLMSWASFARSRSQFEQQAPYAALNAAFITTWIIMISRSYAELSHSHGVRSFTWLITSLCYRRSQGSTFDNS